MDSLDKVWEILDEAEDKLDNAKQSLKRLWNHNYEIIDNKTTEIAMSQNIQGDFVYQERQNIVKVHYAGKYFAGASELSEVDDLKILLYKKETPNSLESLVTLKSEDTYKKQNLGAYVAILQQIEQETEDETQEFAGFRKKFLEGLKDVINKIFEGQIKEKYDATIKGLEDKIIKMNLVLAIQKQEYSARIRTLERQLNKTKMKCNEHHEDIAEKEAELAELRDNAKNIQQEIEDSKVALERKQISPKALARKAEMRYLVADAHIKNGARDIAVIQLKNAIQLYEAAIPGLEQKDDAQTKLSEYQSVLAKLEGQ